LLRNKKAEPTMALSTRTDSRHSGFRGGEVLSCSTLLDHTPQPEILTTDVLLPEQLRGPWRPTDSSPERALMLAILEDAIGCLQKFAHATSVRPRRLAREAEQWIRRRDRTWPCSFDRVCDALDLDAERMRDALLRMKAEQPRAEPQAGADPVPPGLVRLVRSSARAKRPCRGSSDFSAAGSVGAKRAAGRA